MRVNVIGTYNVLEAALATPDTLERLVDFSTSEVFGAHAYKVAEGARHDEGLRRRGPLDVRGLEARRRAHGARLLRRARAADGHRAPVQRLRARPDRRRRDPRVHRGGARRARPDDPRRRLADPRLVLRRRHGRGAACACLERAGGGGPGFNVGNPRSAVTIFDLAQRIRRLAGVPGEIVFQPLHYTDVELRIPNVEKARELLGWEARVELDDGPGADDRVVPGRKPARVSGSRRPDVGAAEAAAVAEVLESRPADDGPEGGASSRGCSPRACGVPHAVAVSSGHGRAPPGGARARDRARRRGARAGVHVPGDGERRRARRRDGPCSSTSTRRR